LDKRLKLVWWIEKNRLAITAVNRRCIKYLEQGHLLAFFAFVRFDVFLSWYLLIAEEQSKPTQRYQAYPTFIVINMFGEQRLGFFEQSVQRKST
ncbi:MAG: hypothetical protein OXE56_03715, partial [Gammaproteobacteria bacterium]|nr:hypothetical protein [Gammaproteobacteria bacterium]